MRSRIKGLAFVVLIIAGIYVAYQTNLTQKLKPEELRAFLDSCGAWAPLAFILINALRPLLYIPSGLFSVVGGLFFGPIYGTVFTVAGSTLGALVAFLIARYLGREMVLKLSKGRLEKWGRLLEGEQGARIIFFMRLMPFFPCDAISYAAGLAPISLGDFSLGTILGIIPGTFVYCFLGSTLQEGLTWRLVLASVLAIGLAVIPTAIHYYQLRKGRQNV